MFLVTKHIKFVFILSNHWRMKQIAQSQEGFSQATREGREEFCFLFPLLSWEREPDHEKKFLGATCWSETIPSFSSCAQEMSIFAHVSRCNSIELSRINVESHQDMLDFRRSLVSCRQSTSTDSFPEQRLAMEPKFVTVTRSDRKRS